MYCFIKVKMTTVNIDQASGLGEKPVKNMLLKDCAMFGAEIRWGTGKRS